eukprot:m.48499 g.48499  ORF g.48499 m.48499 type:complete len:62 (-) comp13291_c0_seq7:373-558(-)
MTLLPTDKEAYGELGLLCNQSKLLAVSYTSAGGAAQCSQGCCVFCQYQRAAVAVNLARYMP